MSSTRSAPPGIPALDNTDGDGYLVPGENDYTRSSKITLRSYISSLTKGTSPLDTVPEIVEYNGPTPPPHANPFPVSVETSDQSNFTDQPGLDDAMDLESEPSQIFGDTRDIIVTGPLGSASSTVAGTGHELLPGVVGSETDGGPVRTTTTGAKAYATSIGRALSNKNLHSGKMTIEDGREFEERSFVSGDVSSVSKRVRLGDSPLGSSYSVPDAKFTEPKDLAKIGRNLMVSAMGVDPDKYESFDKWINGPGGISQIQEPVRVAIAAQGTSLEDLNRVMLSRGQDSTVVDDGLGTTAGTYTERVWPISFNPDSPYTGGNTGQAAFAAFVTGGTFVAAVLATAVIGSFIPSIAPASVPAEVNSGLANNRKLQSGKFRYEPSNPALGIISAGLDALSDVTGLTLQNPIYVPTNSLIGYGDCVVAGLASFLGVSYGIDPSIILRIGTVSANGNTALLLAEITVRLAVIYADPSSRQYYMGIIRELNRNTTALGGSIESFGAAAGSAALDILGVGSAPSIFDSKLFKFVNTLAQIGDLAYTQAAAIDYRKSDLESTPSVVYSTFDAGAGAGQKTLMQGFGARRVYGDKIQDRRGVSYSLADLPSYHLVPSGTSQAYPDLLGSSAAAKRIKSVGAKGSTDGRLRFSPEQVSEIESTLDAEYMPFYFQDLRTNEIIAFHAFLDDLSDSYQANYNNAGGYGRIEEIKTYKDTKRSVGCTFHIIATNPQDFEYMWWQINKLTTMVYPQWSQGRALQTDNDIKFTQPFSQIPTATPVIRVRVGDLIRSNYSRFNLKRLFGYQDNEKKQSTATAGLAASVLYTISPGYYPGADGQSAVRLDSAATAIKDRTRTEEISDNIFIIIGGEGSPSPSGKSIIVDAGNYTEAAAAGFDVSTDVTSFYDPANNAIVRSFESTRGMGLASVVTSLSFTWMDGLWGAGEDGPGNRAPRSCKVQMSFDPIHDIAPGLDHEGFNRAPIYPVGGLVNSIVEGGEQEPYGVGTLSRGAGKTETAVAKVAYEQAFKQSILQKLF
jgi:hypothetical protein